RPSRFPVQPAVPYRCVGGSRLDGIHHGIPGRRAGPAGRPHRGQATSEATDAAALCISAEPRGRASSIQPMTRLILIVSIVSVSLAASCSPPSEAERLIDQAIDAHGMDRLHHAVLSFDFRGKHLELMRDGGRFRFQRTYSDSTGSYLEVFSNDSLYRRR